MLNTLAALRRRAALLILAGVPGLAACTPATGTPLPTDLPPPPPVATDAEAAPPTAAGEADTPAPPEPAGTEASESAASPVAGDDAPVGATATFTNTQLGYAVDHPADWFVQDDGQTVMLTSFDMATAAAGDVPTDQTKIDIMALSGFPLDLDARVAQIEAEAGAGVETETLALPGGERAVWLRFTGTMAGDTAVVVTILGDELYQLQAYGNPEPLKDIALTLRAAATEGAAAP